MIAAAAFGWALLTVPALMRRRLRRLDPSTWSKLAAACLAVGAGLVGLGLVTMAVPTLLEGVGAHHLAALCRRLLHDVMGAGHLGGLTAAAVLAFMVFRAYAAVRRLRRARKAAQVEPWVGEHHRAADHEVVVVPTDTLLAVTPGGRSTQVIFSSGLKQLLDHDELALVLRHELSHLRRRHHRYLSLATGVEAALGWLPFVRSSVGVVRLGVERCADEDATGNDPAARRLLYSTLLAASGVHPNPDLAGFGALDMLKDRLEALSEERTRTSVRRWYPGVVAVSMAAAAAWLGSMAVLGISLTSSGLCYF